MVGLPAVLGNDADVAGLAEALFGAGKGLSPIFYITIGSGIGGGLIINGEIYRGVGRGAAEIGHLLVDAIPYIGGYYEEQPLEFAASGWSIRRDALRLIEQGDGRDSLLWQLIAGDSTRLTARHVGEAAAQGDRFALKILECPVRCLADAICKTITLLCPRRIILGGGVSLMSEDILYEPLRRIVARYVFRPFAGLTDIVPAALGEEVVVHGAIALARRRFPK